MEDAPPRLGRPQPEPANADGASRAGQPGNIVLQARRLEALGSVSGAVGHEFNNLLTVALANLEPLERGADERALRRLSRAQEAVRRAARLTQQVLAFARRPLDGAEDADLRDVLTGLDALLAQAAGPSVRVTLDLPDRPCPARLDVGWLEVELLHLARSARAAMPGGGELRFSLPGDAGSGGTGEVLLLVAQSRAGADQQGAQQPVGEQRFALRFPRGGGSGGSGGSAGAVRPGEA